MKKILIESFNPKFNRLDFIKFIFENTHYGLKDSKRVLDKVIDNEEVDFIIEDNLVKDFIEKLSLLGVFCKTEDNP
nr:hypothetical protein [uncultured Allomuricauda sp.]